MKCSWALTVGFNHRVLLTVTHDDESARVEPIKRFKQYRS